MFGPGITLSASSTSMSLLVALVGAVLYIVTKAYRSRKIINDLRKQGLVCHRTIREVLRY